MSFLRDILWRYPDRIIPYITRYAFFFRSVTGFIVGITAFFLFSWIFVLQKSNGFDITTFKEGIIAQGLEVNPFDISGTGYAHELSYLVYTPLVTIDTTGKLLPGLSESWSISEDGKTYSFFLRRNVTWHDGVAFTTEDVRTTFEMVKAAGDSLVIGKIMENVTVETPNSSEITFKLPQANASFIELLQIGIIPSHLYKGYTYSRFESELQDGRIIGTGPYRFVSLTDSIYKFQRYERFYGRKPNIPIYEVHVYQSYENAAIALRKGDIYSLYNVPASKISEFANYPSMVTEQQVLATNTRALFYNLTLENSLLTENIRKALAFSIDRLEIISELPGAQIAYGPYSSFSWAYNNDVEQIVYFDPDEAIKLIEQDGWKKDPVDNIYTKDDKKLELTVTYLNNETNTSVISKIQGYARAVGINLLAKQVTGTEIIQQILPERNFEMLLFEIQNTIDPDIYTLWHSSQIKYPGLNISGYDSLPLDGLLERARSTLNRDRRLSLYSEAQKTIVEDVPAVFLYHPAIYTVRFDIIDMPETTALVPGQRFNTIADWKIEPRWRNWQTR